MIIGILVILLGIASLLVWHKGFFSCKVPVEAYGSTDIESGIDIDGERKSEQYFYFSYSFDGTEYKIRYQKTGLMTIHLYETGPYNIRINENHPEKLYCSFFEQMKFCGITRKFFAVCIRLVVSYLFPLFLIIFGMTILRH